MPALDVETLPRIDLGRGSFVLHQPAWLPAPLADAWLATALAELPWVQHRIMLFGREVSEPRLIAWGGARAYRYSGKTLPAAPLHPALRGLIDHLAPLATWLGAPAFDHVLANRYRDGRDSMGFHADAEPELGPNPVIVSLSLGAPRRFVLKARRAPRDRRTLWLGHGDLCVMGGTCQSTHVHGVPREHQAGERVSLTFRALLRDPDERPERTGPPHPARGGAAPG